MARSCFIELSPDGLVIESENPSLWPDGRVIGRAEAKRLKKANAHKVLISLLQPSSTVYTVLKTVSASGMSRTIAALIVRPDTHEIQDVSGYVADLCDYRRGKHGGVVMEGAGMDMGFALVYSLGANLWPEGTDKPHSTRNGEPDSDGGYALKHRWL
jgi:hypothetical protein